MADLALTAALAKALGGGGEVDPAVIEEAVNDWLDDHPEATTTVEDGSITKAKLDSNLQGTVDDVDDLKSAFDTTESAIEDKLIKQVAHYSGNIVDMSTAEVAADNWLVSWVPFTMPNGVFYMNPFASTRTFYMRLRPVDSSGTPMSMTKDGSTTESSMNIGDAGWFVKLIVSDTEVVVKYYASISDYDADFPRGTHTYTTSSRPDHWEINGNINTSNPSLDVGLTIGEYSTVYVEYTPPTYSWEYTAKLAELPYIDAESLSDFVDTTRIYRLFGKLYYYTGSSWTEVDVKIDDSITRINRNVPFTTFCYSETDASVVNSSTKARTLHYIPTDETRIIADGTFITGIEVLAWDSGGTYIGVWDQQNETFVKIEKLTTSVDIANLISKHPGYKYKINAKIESVSSANVAEISEHLTWVYSKAKEEAKMTEAMNSAILFDCSGISVVDNTIINGATGLEVINNNCIATGFIDISRRLGNKIKFNTTFSGSPYGFAIYDKGKRWVSGLWRDSAAFPTSGYVIDNVLSPQRVEWVLPENAYYLRAFIGNDWYTEPSDFGIEFYEAVETGNNGTLSTGLMTIAHKGYGNASYENTLYSFINAGEIGFKGVEIDCRKMADGVYIASHSASQTLYSNGTGTSVTFATANWSDIAGMTIDAEGYYPLANVGQIFSALRKYGVEYYIIDLKTGSNADIIDIARRCGVVDKLLLSYYDYESFAADVELLQLYPDIPIRFTPSLTNEQYLSIRNNISNKLYADINAAEGMGNSYIPNSFAWKVPILFAGATETTKQKIGPIAAGIMSNMTLQYSPSELVEMTALNYSQFPTLTASAESASLSTGTTATITVTSSIDDPACYVYGYSDDLSVFSVAQTAYGAETSFTLTKVGTGSANFIVFTASGEQVVIPVTVS